MYSKRIILPIGYRESIKNTTAILSMQNSRLIKIFIYRPVLYIQYIMCIKETTEKHLLYIIYCTQYTLCNNTNPTPLIAKLTKIYNFIKI